RSGTICGIELPEELVECEKLPEPLFTPSTKAEIGGHDENIHPSKVTALIGEKHANAMAAAAVQVSSSASTPGADRRGFHARLVTLLASIDLRVWPSAGLVRQAVPAQLPRVHQIRQDQWSRVARGRRPENPQ
ncbi:hypothetical protein BC938DRAFT_470529, partial [Jimgerdemannia flammicorona]